MYTGILHTHILAVTLFVLLFLIKTLILLSGRHERLAFIRKKTRILEMVLPLVFIASGIWLGFHSGETGRGNWFWVKLGLILVSVPLSIIALKRSSRLLALLALLIFIYMMGLSWTKNIFLNTIMPAEAGAGVHASVSAEQIYGSHCRSCHGTDGKLGLSGAPDLSLSSMAAGDRVRIILEGKGAMPAFEGVLTAGEAEAVAMHLEGFRK